VGEYVCVDGGMWKCWWGLMSAGYAACKMAQEVYVSDSLRVR
jgi:hypothetical protein